ACRRRRILFPASGEVFPQLASLRRRVPRKSVRPPLRSRASCRKHSKDKCARRMENERKGAGSRLRCASQVRSQNRKSSDASTVTSRGSDRAEQPLSVNELELLKPVSRSFYISIRLLPRPLRQPVALAYLLARTSDTIADSSAVNVEKRIELLDRFARAVVRKEEGLGEELKQILVSKHVSFRPITGRRNTVEQPSG